MSTARKPTEGEFVKACGRWWILGPGPVDHGGLAGLCWLAYPLPASYSDPEWRLARVNHENCADRTDGQWISAASIERVGPLAFGEDDRIVTDLDGEDPGDESEFLGLEPTTAEMSR